MTGDRPRRGDASAATIVPDTWGERSLDRGTRPPRLVLSCEHASRHVPARHAGLFAGGDVALRSHRGSDLGAGVVARDIARRTAAPLAMGRVTRLLVDLNRSVRRRGLFSEFSRALPAHERQALIDRWHTPHWSMVAEHVERILDTGGRALHLGVHSFTPVLRGELRDFDVGLLYDPSRPAEAAACRRLALLLTSLDPGLRVRRNRPYRGVADGITTAFRGRYGGQDYLGIELELNQARLVPGAPGAADFRRTVSRAVVALLTR